MQSSHQPHHTKQPVQHPDHAEPGEMMRQHRQRTLWMDFANLMLGGWLLSTSVVFHAHSSGLMLQIAASRSTRSGGPPMAHDGVTEGDETANDEPPKGKQFEGIDYLKRFSQLIERGKTILDVGCGDGLPVDAYLVKQGFAVNGIDASARMVARARKNVPEGFYEIKDLFDLREGEYCVDGVVSLRAMLQIPHEKYRALLKIFASFMPNSGALLLFMRADEPGQAGEDAHGALASRHHDDVGDSTELLEDAGYTIILNEIGALGDTKHQIILARS